MRYQESVLNRESLAELLGVMEVTRGDVDKVSRLRSTKWGESFKQQLTAFLSGSAGITVNGQVFMQSTDVRFASEHAIERFYLRMLYRVSKYLNEYDMSFIEKLDVTDTDGKKVEHYFKDKGIKLDESLRKELGL